MSEILRLPYGVIDPHVHMRDPEQEYKEDFTTGTRAALAGGVTLVLDMPNNTRHVKSLELLLKKIQLASQKVVCDIGFHFGTLGEEGQNFEEAYPYSTGLKGYFNVSTGHYVITDPVNRHRMFQNWKSEKPILVHAEGFEAHKAIDLAEKHDRVLYLCHMSREEEVYWLRDAKKRRPGRVFGEVTPHHLFIDNVWSPDPYKQMKPPLSGLRDRLVLWEALRDGTIDVVATDHAPHTKHEKESANPPSGVTGLETTLPLLLMAERAGWISMKRIREVVHDNPRQIFDLPEQPETYVDVLRDSSWFIDGDALQTKCHTTPFQGARVLDKVYRVTLRGKVVYEDGKVLAEPGSGLILPKLKST